MKRALRISAIAIFLLLLIFAGVADARYNDGSSGSPLRGVDNNDIVFIGESELNFTKFNLSGYTDMRIRGASGDDENAKISLDFAETIDTTGNREGTYYLYINESAGYNESMSVTLVDPNKVFSEIAFTTATKEPYTAEGTELSALSNVMYMLKGSRSSDSKIQNAMDKLLALASQNNWKIFDFTISISNELAPADSSTMRTVTNVYGNEYDLNKFSPLAPKTITGNEEGFFTYSNSKNHGKYLFPLEAIIEFTIDDNPGARMGLNGLEIERRATQRIVDSMDFAIKTDEGTGIIHIEEGSYTDLTLEGTPYQPYKFTIIPEDKDVYLGSDTTKNTSVTIVPTKKVYSADDNENLRLHADESADENKQYSLIITVLESTSTSPSTLKEVYTKSIPITIDQNEHKPVLELSEEVKSGQFSAGDIIRVTWNYIGLPYSDNGGEKGYIYLEGMNFNKQLINTVNFTDPVKLFYLDTSKLDAGSYTLSLAGRDHTAEIAFYLNTPLLTASISGGDKGTLVQGSKLQLNWNARGSPFANYTHDPGNRVLETLPTSLYQGNIQWYIFGTNFASAGNSTFSLINGTLGKNVPNGEGSHIFNRTFTKNLAPGTYYVIVQHPGADKIFSLKPRVNADGSTTTLKYIDVFTDGSSTTPVSTLDVANKQTDNAAEMVRSFLDNGQTDDLYVQLQFQIEEPWFAVTEMDGGKVGDTLSIYGATNYPTGETVSFTITPITFTPQDATNTQMQMTAYYEAEIEDTGEYNRRTFVVTDISTANWYPGTYSGKFKLKDTNDEEVIKSVSFAVGETGIITTPDITLISKATAAPTTIATPKATAYATAQATATSTATPTPTQKSPAPAAGLFIGLAAAILGMIKLQRR